MVGPGWYWLGWLAAGCVLCIWTAVSRFGAGAPPVPAHRHVHCKAILHGGVARMSAGGLEGVDGCDVPRSMLQALVCAEHAMPLRAGTAAGSRVC
jgi:hypothetical protein